MSSSEQRGGFQRLYLVDFDLSPGVITMLPLTGNTIFVGRNGVGKTSRMALIAFFLGAEPGEVVSRGKEKKFDEFYLPRSSSYLCMDYRTADGQDRCVMAYMTTSNQLAYRFIQAHFDKSWIHEDGRFVEPTGLIRRLHEADVAFHSSQITTTREYRSIIQGVPDGRPSPDYRTLRATYSLAGSRHALPKIDKIILGMIHKMVDLRSLQSIILACIQNDNEAMGGDPLALMGHLDHIDELVQQGEALEETERAEPHFHAAEEAYKTVHQASTSKARLKASITLSLPKMEERHAEQVADIQSTETRLDALREEFSTLTGGLKSEIKTAEKQILATQNRLDQLEGERLEWDRKSPAAMENRAANEDVFRQQLRTTEERLETLLGEASSIETEFDKLRMRIERTHADAVEAATSRATGEQEHLQTERDAAIRDGNSKLQSLRDEHEKSLETFEKKNGENHVSLARLEAFKAVPDEAMLEERSRLDTVIESDQAAVDSAQIAFDEVRNRSDEVHKQSSKELDRKKEKSNAIARLNEEIKNLNAQIEANNASLLGYLRAEVPNWEGTIGKVVDPKLLQRADLSPHFDSRSEASIYGLHLDISGVLPPEDVDALKEHLKAREATLKDLKSDLADIQKRLDSLGKSMKEVDQDKSSAELRHRVAKDQLKRRKEEKRQLLTDQQVALRKLADENASAIADMRDKCKQSASELGNFREEVKLQIEEAQEVQNARLNGIDERIRAVKTALNEEKRQAANIRDNALRKCDEDLAVKLKAEGLDSRILDLRTDKERFNKELNQIKRDATALRQWLEFKRRLPVEKAESEQDLERLQYQRNAFTERLEDAESRRDKETSLLSNALRQKKTDEQRLGGGIKELIRAMSHALDEIEPDPEGAQASFDPDFLLMEVKAAEDLLRQSQKDLDAAFHQLRRAFMKRGESEVAKSWRAEEISKAGGSHYGALREHLTGWYRYGQQAAHHVYLSQLANLSLAINNFASSRKHFHEEVRSFGLRLKKALDRITISNAIQNLVLNISSDSRDDSFMPKALLRLQEMEVTADVLANDPDMRTKFVNDVRLLRNKLQESNTLKMKPEQMINIVGHVTENGNVRKIDRTTKLTEISSSGLSVMIQSTILMAFIHQVRGDAPIDFTWGIDELGTIDDSNVILLVEALNRHHIHLVTAQPNVTASTAVFKSFKWAVKTTPRGNIQAVEVAA